MGFSYTFQHKNVSATVPNIAAPNAFSKTLSDTYSRRWDYVLASAQHFFSKMFAGDTLELGISGNEGQAHANVEVHQFCSEVLPLIIFILIAIKKLIWIKLEVQPDG